MAGLALAFIAPVAAMLVQMAVSRSREYLADETGARICGDPRPLAGALVKSHAAAQVRPMAEASPATAHLFIVSPLVGGSLRKLFSTHPPLEERVARLEALGRGRS
jgi:heat shock protein HtpX